MTFQKSKLRWVLHLYNLKAKGYTIFTNEKNYLSFNSLLSKNRFLS